MNYEGQSRDKRPVSAADLASADVVLTTYTVLARDIYLQPDVGNEREHNLRHAKRYEVHTNMDSKAHRSYGHGSRLL